jgi:GH15 family glucan-1,4-alpha-glucosidase
VLSLSHQEPLVFPPPHEADERLEATIAFWRRWAGSRTYDGPWREAVTRSALALKLLVFAPSGAIAAAATTSLPEELGGERNWDYRYSWVRDSAFTLEAFLRLGCPSEAEAFFSWLMHASQLTHPRLQVLYRLDGGASAPERTLDLDGYRGSKPVRVGNAAAGQTQLDVYGDVFQTAWLYACARGALDRDIGRRIADIADLVCKIWRRPDSGIWEVRSEPVHFIHSKMMCWVALDRASKLARSGQIPDHRLELWESEAEAIRTFVETHGWSEAKQSYVRSAGSTDLDASLLMAVLFGYDLPSSERLRSTVHAIRTELGKGPLLYRYTGEDGLGGSEGSFLTCSFWLVDALARLGQVDQAAESMEALLAFSNDVGLYAEEVEPETGEFLGNLPQALVHLALINAAASISEQQRP